MSILQFQWRNEQGDRAFHICQVDDIPRQGDTVAIERDGNVTVGVVGTVVWGYKVERFTEVSPDLQTTCRPVALLDDVVTHPIGDYPFEHD